MSFKCISRIPAIVRFGFIGVAATLTHAAVFLVLTYFGLSGFLSNLIAYLVALISSYVGHALWTFRGRTRNVKKFFITSLLGLGANSLFAVIVVDWLQLPAYLAAIPMVVVTPVATYFALKHWVFKSTD